MIFPATDLINFFFRIQKLQGEFSAPKTGLCKEISIWSGPSTPDIPKEFVDAVYVVSAKNVQKTEKQWEVMGANIRF